MTVTVDSILRITSCDSGRSACGGVCFLLIALALKLIRLKYCLDDEPLPDMGGDARPSTPPHDDTNENDDNLNSARSTLLRYNIVSQRTTVL